MVSGSEGRGLTIVSLRDAVLDTPALCKIGNLGPVLVGVCVGTESAAVAVVGRTGARTGVVSRAMHGWMCERRRLPKKVYMMINKTLGDHK